MFEEYTSPRTNAELSMLFTFGLGLVAWAIITAALLLG